MMQSETAPASTGDAAPSGDPVIVTELSEFSENLRNFIEHPSWGNAASTFLPVLLDIGRIILVVVVLLVVVSYLARWVQRAVDRGLAHTGIDQTLKSLASRMVKYAVWILAIPVALGILGVEATSMAAVLGAAGLAIGLGLQGALSNISAGIMLLVLRPIRIGDLVEIQDEAGEVRDIGLFYTTINTFSNEVVSIPNQQILSDKVENLTGNRTRRVEVPVGVAYGADLREAERVLREAAESVAERDVSQEPKVLLTGFGESSIDFVVFVYCPARHYLTARHQAVLAMNDALTKAGIEIPFPQRTVSGTLKLAREPADAD